MADTLLLGEVKPMSHQRDDVSSLWRHPRVNLWNGLGTGKMFTGAWLAQRWWLEGMIDSCIVVAPSMCAPDWMNAFTHVAWPDGLANVYDARPPDQEVVHDAMTHLGVGDRGRMDVFVTSYGGLRSIAGTRTASRYRIDLADPLYAGMRGRRIAVIFDEAQAAALQTSQQGDACRAIAGASRGVISMTATPIGNPLTMRLWGMTTLVRPDVLVGPRDRDVSSFTAFKARYGVLVDPVQQQAERAGRQARFIAARAYPVSINQSMVDAEILAPMAPYSARRTKEECLDLPAKVRMRRSYRAPPEVRRLLDSLVDDDRAILSDGSVIVVDNALEERLRTIELASGWLADRIVHPLKVRLLEEVMNEIDENIGQREPVCVWASRTRELLACALACAGTPAEEAMRLGSAGSVNDGAYRDCVSRAANGRVGIIHGRTPPRDRDRIQADWKAGLIRTVVAHPAVAGAGLNWQHVKATVYFSQPLGTITRQQSEDRVHRHGLRHTALYYDLVMEDGPDQAVAVAHARQADAARAMLDWLDRHGRAIRA